MTENEAREMLEKHYQFLRETWKPYPDGKVLDALGIAISSIEEIQRYRAIGTVEECREAREVKHEITEIVNQQLIAGKNNYKEVYGCFYDIAKVIQDHY